MKILHVECSPMGKKSISRELGETLISELKLKNSDINITDRDLAVNPLPHLNEDILESFFTPEDKHTDNHKELISSSEDAIKELFVADTIVIEAPMWNFGIPSVLKAWIDHIVRAGKTFRYTENGPEGLVTGKKAIIISARGGVYSEGSPQHNLDHQEQYLKAVLGFIGITDVEVIRAEGIAMGEDMLAKAKQTAQQQITDIISQVG